MFENTQLESFRHIYNIYASLSLNIFPYQIIYIVIKINVHD